MVERQLPKQNVPPADRFLIAWFRLSAKDAEAFIPGASDEPTAVAVVLGYCYADVPLPATCDVVFRYDSPEDCEPVDLAVVLAFADGHYPVDALQHGYKHVAVLQFKGTVPLLIQQMMMAPLPADIPTAAEYIGICRSKDYAAIRDRCAWQQQA